MNLIFRYSLAIAAWGLIPTAFAQTPARPSELRPSATRSVDVDRAVTALRSISTLRADFVQISENGQRVSGVLSLKNPGRIRFQYAKGVPLLIISDGRSLWMIDSEVNQRQRWPIGNSPLGALLDPKRDVAMFGTIQPTGNANLIAVDVRDRKHPEYGSMTLVFERKSTAPGGLELTAWAMLDAQNKRTQIRLSGHQYGVALADSLFRYLDISARPHK